jgi:hypothetical protein
VRLLAPEVVREPDDDPDRAVEAAGLADEAEHVLGTPGVDAASSHSTARPSRASRRAATAAKSASSST